MPVGLRRCDSGKFVLQIRRISSAKRRWWLAFLGVFLLSANMGSQTNVKQGKPVPQSPWVRKILGTLTLEEKIGQLIMPALQGTYLSSGSAEFLEIQRQIQRNHVGGFVLF